MQFKFTSCQMAECKVVNMMIGSYPREQKLKMVFTQWTEDIYVQIFMGLKNFISDIHAYNLKFQCNLNSHSVDLLK